MTGRQNNKTGNRTKADMFEVPMKMQIEWRDNQNIKKAEIFSLKNSDNRIM